MKRFSPGCVAWGTSPNLSEPRLLICQVGGGAGGDTTNSPVTSISDSVGDTLNQPHGFRISISCSECYYLSPEVWQSQRLCGTRMLMFNATLFLLAPPAHLDLLEGGGLLPGTGPAAASRQTPCFSNCQQPEVGEDRRARSTQG